MNNDELNGRYVLVHPALWDDPAEKNGEIGMITENNLDDDIIKLRFNDEKHAFYASNALLVFQPSDNLYETLKQNATLLSAQNFKDLKSVALLLDYGRPEQTKAAMGLVLQNPDLLEMSMVSLEDSFVLTNRRQIGR
ncbi:hypothetical protein SAMN05192574_105315 [Mucilaginibacter gossypiicola]|uniref:Uncharacterized protein n=1 Tax=Mucilaginibacter gossypiicola TaxID=551995 RepID=A0A1H8LYZ7_9SPHI|nr:hypothetical protein [Mucilaginibacter gossypiicola]SEO10374.1 hypothetical protein SAMN05192574_105315 [Mucilaginibacter gossypiicola]